MMLSYKREQSRYQHLQGIRKFSQLSVLLLGLKLELQHHQGLRHL